MVITWAISVGVPTRCSGMGASKRASRSDTAESSDADVVDRRVDGPVAEDRVQCFGGSGPVGEVRRGRPGEPDHFMLVTGQTVDDCAARYPSTLWSPALVAETSTFHAVPRITRGRRAPDR